MTAVVGFGFAATPDEVRAVQRLRYDVYVEELGRYRSVADHAARTLSEHEDERSWLAYVEDDGQVVAATRLTWGASGFSPRQIEQYQLRPWLEELPAELLLVGERTTVRPSHRGTQVLDLLMERTASKTGDHGVQVVFGCCEPHLLNLYLATGQRPYASQNINSDEAGYLIPLVGFTTDPEALRGTSRLRGAHDLPHCVERALAGGSTVRSSAMGPTSEYWAEIRRTLEALHAQRVSAFDGLSDAEAERCLSRSHVIDCRAGDRLLKQGGAARNMFVLLSGELEVRDGDLLVGVLGPGDTFGEMAFLLERDRAFDVFAATDARVLSLSERSLRGLIEDDPAVAATLLLNLAKMLCARLIRAEQGPDQHRAGLDAVDRP